MSIYNFEVALEDGTVYSLEKYAGKPIIIVNTATKCGLAPQFEQLEELYQAYQSQGLVILGFPSNQFKQELASATEAAEACKATYGVTFPMHQLIDVEWQQFFDKFYKVHNFFPYAIPIVLDNEPPRCDDLRQELTVKVRLPR